MKQGTPVALHKMGIFFWIPIAALVIACSCSQAATSEQPEASPQALILLDAAQGATPEMPPAAFRHDVHVKAAGDAGCVTCHAELKAVEGKTQTGVDPFRFVAHPKDKDDWHSTCLACHTEKGQGPQAAECHTCHDSKAPKSAETLPVVFDRSMHAVHVNSKFIAPVQPLPGTPSPSPLQNCGACHHELDEASGNLVYIAGQEEPCASCHLEQTEGKVLSLREASHAQCITCHLQSMEMATATGQKLEKLPVDCADCHSLAGQQAFPKGDKEFRLMRGQKDSVVMEQMGPKAAEGAVSPEAAKGLPLVVFNHKLHETVVESCSTCHHKGFKNEGCQTCHTLAGSADSNYTSWYDAMHDANSNHSCVGCHQQYLMTEKNCVMCHADLKPVSQNTCNVCHTGMPDEKAQAASQTPALSLDEIPRTVVIGSLSNEYAPATMPHRQIYEALAKRIADNDMAKAFHVSPETTCGGCHHNVPAGDLKNPPKCASCHTGQPGIAQSSHYIPSLKIAYHKQCMTCHERMNVKPVATDCTGCHALKTTGGQEVK